MVGQPSPGTTLEDPVTVEQVPDLKQSVHDITEYFEEHDAYGLFEYLLRELVTKAPDDPLEHMVKCLQTPYHSGPLKVIISSAPCSGRRKWSQKIAEHFGLTLISAGGLCRDAGLDVDNLDYAADNQVAELVMEQIQSATDAMQGWVLDGFPRTRTQTSYLKELSVVPSHVFVLQAPEAAILARSEQIGNGDLDGDYISPELLEKKLRMFTCHHTSALETYGRMIRSVDAMQDDESIWSELESNVRKLPRALGPHRLPRVVILGPRGSGFREHASRLAASLGSVFVDFTMLCPDPSAKKNGMKVPPMGQSSMTQTFTAPDADAFEVIRERLKKHDCESQGWVLSGFPRTLQEAQTFVADVQLAPFRVIVLDASVDTCVSRLRLRHVDTITGKVWSTRPRSEKMRKRLERDPMDQPAAVAAAHEQFSSKIGEIFNVFKGGAGGSTKIKADGNSEAIFGEVADFVSRPLPLPAPPAKVAS